MPAGQSGDAAHDSHALFGQLRAAAETLRTAGVDAPQVDAKLLMACAYGVELHDIDKAMLLGRELPGRGKPDDAQAAGRFKTMLARRAAREPLQYITGHAPFRFLDLAVGPGVFIPRPETESVVQAALDWLSGQGIAQPRIVDLCAGSGAIGLSIATELPGSQVWAVERSPQALAWTRRNRDAILGDAGLRVASSTTQNNLTPDDAASGDSNVDDTPSVVRNHRYHLIQGDATDATMLAELDGTIDAVVTNPPYVPLSQIPEQPEVREHDPDMALYGGSDDGLAIPIAILARSAALLRHGGLLVMEHDISQGQPLVECALHNGFETARTGNDLTGRPRCLFAIRG
ncbi:MAG: peptide chain release factor N(5)-glutamine methyltransferase [Bifidobacterium tibiigranuli]|uniref:N5-glutamine methyltransferase family protein n=1 Tax=Bifidobacterium tibiigranuli TaxID=2172043 RepID=UPI0023535331|nr:HemK/PrmC family methyltransferase [Bifidobacterium tibiigranuli]MCH3973786.1 peptide chain release factor N(5)-glutamine methyltransferase [Bifidobacterium tibiigranuli]MCH4189432.1 peptide chain release factor N(5)-glutamine methyltransferase [Bifidobacterium tibiigranuli]MCH4203782.1 peptide chain release factor N(5)-glutamine methyltransferase [Bifidobacterium tibiigranuli]MCH4274376.1 peptide chain release factor N(5)-glutamine methyltransferase [Bifidobacterium tibiigranuli]MCI1254866